MTKVKHSKTVRMMGDKQEIVEGEYVEVGINELDNMMEKVRAGGNEKELREELIKKSEW